jgi:hypothetical protein
VQVIGYWFLIFRLLVSTLPYFPWWYYGVATECSGIKEVVPTPPPFFIRPISPSLCRVSSTTFRFMKIVCVRGLCPAWLILCTILYTFSSNDFSGSSLLLILAYNSVRRKRKVEVGGNDIRREVQTTFPPSVQFGGFLLNLWLVWEQKLWQNPLYSWKIISRC